MLKTDKTYKIYYGDSFKKEFAATVIDCIKTNNAYNIILDKTIFYPESGGQPADTGQLEIKEGIINISDVREKGDTILHVSDSYIPPGTAVNGKINWGRRFSNMQQHTGEHIVSGVIKEHFKFDNVGFHIGADAVTIDLNGLLTASCLQFIEEKSNEAIYENIPVSAQFFPQEDIKELNYRSKRELSGDIRIVSIPGYDACACCGVHCQKTGEVGIIKILSSVKYKGGTRVSMLCGYRALKDYCQKNEQVYAISELLSVKPNEAYNGAFRIYNENGLLNKRIAALKNETYRLKCNEVPENAPFALMFEEEAQAEELRRFCLLLCERADIAAVFSESNNTLKYALGSKNQDVRIIGGHLNEKYDGRSGGQQNFISGTLRQNPGKAALEEFFKCRS